MASQSNFTMWQTKWKTLSEQLHDKGASVFTRYTAPANQAELAEVEDQLNISLPDELKDLLTTAASEVMFAWSLPHDLPVPFGAAGGLGWSIKLLEFPDFYDEEMEDQQRYLCFYHGQNGDSLLLDLESNPHRPPVVSWNHERNEFRLLAGSLTEFLEKVTALYAIGAESWQYEPFLDHSGLSINHPHAKRWQEWMNDYLHLTMEEAAGNLNRLIRYTEVNGQPDDELRRRFTEFDPAVVWSAWLQRIEQETDQNIRYQLIEYAGLICGDAAADWVRNLWTISGDQRINSSVLANVTASCLPEQEGLDRVFAELERIEQEERLNGYTANNWLKSFHHRRVLKWMMKPKRVSYPYDGWDQLFAESAPQVEDILSWLHGNEVQRQVVITALAKFINTSNLSGDEQQIEQIRVLLHQQMEHAVLKKEKNLIHGAIAALDTVQI